MKNKIIFVITAAAFLGLASAFVEKQTSYINEAMAAFEASQNKEIQEEEALNNFLQRTKEEDARAAQKYLRSRE